MRINHSRTLSERLLSTPIRHGLTVRKICSKAAKGWLRSHGFPPAMCSTSHRNQGKLAMCDVHLTVLKPAWASRQSGPGDEVEKPSAWTSVFSVFSSSTIQGITTWMAKSFHALLLRGYTKAIITRMRQAFTCGRVRAPGRLRLQVLQNSESRMFILRVTNLSARDHHWLSSRFEKCPARSNIKSGREGLNTMSHAPEQIGHAKI